MHTVGQTVQCDGNFTLLRYIRALSARDLERSVGFEQGRLDTGFSVVALADDELLAAADFELKASTRWSAGVIAATQPRLGSSWKLCFRPAARTLLR